MCVVGWMDGWLLLPNCFLCPCLYTHVHVYVNDKEIRGFHPLASFFFLIIILLVGLFNAMALAHVLLSNGCFFLQRRCFFKVKLFHVVHRTLTS